MLAASFLGSTALLIVSTGLLFAPFGAGSRPASRPFAFGASCGAAVTAGAVAWAVGSPATSAVAVVLIITIAGAGWLPLTPYWTARGHVVWTLMTVSGVTYLSYMAVWTFRSELGVLGTIGGVVLLAFEAAAFVLGCMYGWELVDVLARRDWQRRCLNGVVSEPDRFPFVSLHVPAYNEPPDMVIATLESLLAIDYPSYEIIMLDDNTTDEELWRPVEVFCESHGIKFHHLENWPGFKAGALNFALTVTDPRAEVIGVIDADYLVVPDYLRRCAPLFADEALGFLQTPQDYREWESSPYYRRLYYSYKYFFAVSQISRNERGGPIFGGTMGLIRRTALEAVGGWDEWCITEDAELSLRLLRAGYTGQHVEASFGHGVMPLTFEALKRQRFRWCFGGVQILRKHWRSLMPWDRSTDNHLTWKQRYDYLAGGLQWFGDLLAVGFAALLFIGALSLTLGSGVVFRRLSGALLVVPSMLLGLGLVRSVGLIRRCTGASRRDAIGALTIWLALGLTVAKACIQGILHRDGVFLRTPKTKGDSTWTDAIRGNRLEAALGLLILAVLPLVVLRAPTLTAIALGTLLAWHAAAFLLAPAQSLAALRADLSPELRALRRTEWVRERLVPTIKPVGAGVATLAFLGATAMAFVLLAPQPSATGPTADLFAEAQGKPPAPASPTTTALSDVPATSPDTTTVGQPGQSNPSFTTLPTSTDDATSSTQPAGAVSSTASPQPGVVTTNTTQAGTPTTNVGLPTTTRTTTPAPQPAPSTPTTPSTPAPPSTPSIPPHR